MTEVTVALMAPFSGFRASRRMSAAIAFVRTVPSWNRTPGCSQRRKVSPSGDHSHLVTARGTPFPSHPMEMGASRVNESMIAGTPVVRSLMGGIEVPTVNRVPLTGVGEDRVQEDSESAISSATTPRNPKDPGTNVEREAVRTIGKQRPLCHRSADPGTLPVATVGGGPVATVPLYIGRCGALLQ